MLRGEVWRINLDPTIGAEIRGIRRAESVNEALRFLVRVTRENQSALGK